jgi:UDP:flavonoid glycosyltransferase YjiC (YdhE family)
MPHSIASTYSDLSQENDNFPWNQLGPHPLIYICPPATNRLRFLQAAADAFGGLPFEVVVSPSHPGQPSPAPPNFLFAASVPLARLLVRTTLAIAAADPATVAACARAGVLQLLYPENDDQSLLARGLAHIGAGRLLTDADLEGARLRAIAGRVMAEPAYCRAAEALRQSLPESGSASEICSVIVVLSERLSPESRPAKQVQTPAGSP